MYIATPILVSSDSRVTVKVRETSISMIYKLENCALEKVGDVACYPHCSRYLGTVPLCLEQHLKTLNIYYQARLSYQVPTILCKGL